MIVNKMESSLSLLSKVSEYSFKQYKKMLQKQKSLLYTNFCNISLKLLRPTFFNISYLPFTSSPNIKKIRVKVQPETNHLSCFMSSSDLQNYKLQ